MINWNPTRKQIFLFYIKTNGKVREMKYLYPFETDNTQKNP